MVVIRLSYGLGNQMFQYAFGRRIELEKNVSVKYDITWYNKALPNELRPMQLNIFNCNLNICTQQERDYFYNSNSVKRIIGKLRRDILPYYKQKIICEKYRYNYDENIYINIKKNNYYSGFWQNEKYFIKIANTLKNDFTLKEKLDTKNQRILDEIIENYDNSVCLHIRRGDYVGNPFFDLVDLDYYKNAIDYIKERVNNPIFFLFSNDFNWVKTNFIGKEFRIININDELESYKDLELMKNCKNFIISNSTFSWWAAWLSKYQNQIIIAPSKWANFPDTTEIDIIPANWIIL